MIIVGEETTIKGVKYWAEIVPSPPLVVMRRGASLRHLFTTGRTWKQPFCRWWIEVMSDTDGGTHHIDQDTGASTLRRAIYKAYEAVEDAMEEL